MPPISHLALVLPLAASLLGTTTPGPADDLVTSAQRQVLDYWTADRMLHALTPPARPRPQLSSAPAAGRPQTIPGKGGTVRGTVGKVFFTLDGRDYVCSAGTVAAKNDDLVVTAGHCAKDGTGSWAHNWIYVPGYDRGTSPYGSFPARHMFVPKQWAANADEDYDVAMVALGTDGGRHVARLGTQGIAFDQPRGHKVSAFGYPAESPYSGEHVASCAGRTRPDPHHLTHDEGLRCALTEGSSGGPWLSGYHAGRGMVTSVNSFKYAEDSTTMYGPYFGSVVHKLYDRAERA